jgi:hypothetical protein
MQNAYGCPCCLESAYKCIPLEIESVLRVILYAKELTSNLISSFTNKIYVDPSNNNYNILWALRPTVLQRRALEFALKRESCDQDLKIDHYHNSEIVGELPCPADYAAAYIFGIAVGVKDNLFADLEQRARETGVYIALRKSRRWSFLVKYNNN